MRRLSLAALGAAALAALLWHWVPTAPPGRPGDASGPASGVGDAASATADGVAEPTPGPDRTAREALPQAAASTGWTIQLVGIDPAVPWTAPFGLSFERRPPIQVAIDAGGEGHFEPPAYARSPGFQHLLLVAKDDHYILDRSYHRTDSLQQTGRASFAVYPIALLRGRVLGPDGAGIAARVRAFGWTAAGPRDAALARAESTADGRYELRVPPGVPVLLLAEALGATAPQLLEPTASPLLAFEVGESPTLDDPPPRDLRPVRMDLTPATVRSEGDHLRPRSVPDLRLGTTAVLAGRATFADGRPLANCEIVAEPTVGDAIRWRDHFRWSPTAGFVVGGHTRTDAQGAFALPLAPGVPFAVLATTDDPLLLAGEPSATASAPGYVDLVATGDLVELQVVADGVPAPQAAIELDSTTWRSDAAGRLRVTLGPAIARARAHTAASASAWLALAPGARPARATLDLVAEPLAEVRLLLHCDAILREAEFALRPRAGGYERVLTARRAGDDTPFVLRVPADRYRVTVRGAELAPGAAFLVPLQLDLDVPTQGMATAATITFGGQMGLDVRDRNGVRPGGTFSLRDADDRDVTPGTQRIDELGDRRIELPGVLQPGFVNHLTAVLRPGVYTLAVDAEGRRGQQTVTVQAGAYTTVSLRLP